MITLTEKVEEKMIENLVQPIYMLPTLLNSFRLSKKTGGRLWIKK